MSTFLPVPAYVVGRSDVSWGAKVCLGLLYRHERSRRKGWPCVAEIVDGMGQPRRTVERWLSELVGTGLATSQRDGRETRYAPFLAVDGSKRDLDPSNAAPTEHPPEVADVPAENPPHLAGVSTEHPPPVADVGDSHLYLKIRDLGGERGPTPTGVIESAYAEALGTARPPGMYVANPTRDNPHWRAALEAVRVMANGEPLNVAALRLARGYVGARRSRSPEWFAEWLQKRAASGDQRAMGGRVEPLPNSAYRGSSDDEIREAFGDVSDEELARLDGPRRRHG